MKHRCQYSKKLQTENWFWANINTKEIWPAQHGSACVTHTHTHTHTVGLQTKLCYKIFSFWLNLKTRLSWRSNKLPKKSEVWGIFELNWKTWNRERPSGLDAKEVMGFLALMRGWTRVRIEYFLAAIYATMTVGTMQAVTSTDTHRARGSFKSFIYGSWNLAGMSDTTGGVDML